MFKRLTSMFLCLSALTLPVCAQTGKESIESLVKVFSTLHGHHWELRPAELAEAAKYINYPSMAQRALGDEEWSKLTAAQKKNYLQSFKAIIERRYYTRWRRIFAQSKICYGTEQKKGEDFLVNTTVTTAKSNKNVIWNLTGEPPKLVNLTVGEHDLLQVAHSRFQRKIAGVGLPVFVAWLQKRSKLATDADDDVALTSGSR
jgi:ABC-type transporter MlaC component